MLELKRKDKVNDSKVFQFKEEARTFYVKMMEKLFERLPLGSSVVRNSRIFDPKIMFENSDATNERCMENISNVLIKLKIITPVFGDKSLRQFCEYLSKDLKENMENFKEFDRKV